MLIYVLPELPTGSSRLRLPGWRTEATPDGEGRTG